MNRESKIGLFVLVGLGAVVFLILRTSDVGSFFKAKDPMRVVEVALDDASGMRDQTSVEIAGVKVGKILEVTLKNGLPVARISLPADLVLKQGARAEARSKGILGDRFLSLSPGIGPPLADQDHLSGGAPPSLEDIATTLKKLGDNLVAITESFKEGTLTASGGNRIEEISANIERLTTALVAMVENNRTNVDATAANVAGLTASLNRDIPALVAEISGLVSEFRGITGGNRQKIDDTMANMADLSDNIKQATSSLSEIATKINEGQGTIGKLVNESETSEKLNTLLDSANDSLGEVKKFLKKADNLELDFTFRGDYLAERDATKGYFGIRLAPNPDKFYLLEGVFAEDSLLIPEFDETVEETFDPDGNLLTRTLISHERKAKDILFTAQLAYRFGPVFLRGGIIEDTAGAGIEYAVAEKKINFSFETFDFSRDDLSPHSKVDVRYRIAKGLYFNAGWDDMLESDRASAFAGAGIRWKDDDLKTLLSSVGSLVR